MFHTNSKSSKIKKIYTQIVLLSRNKLLYNEFKLNDDLISRVNLIFMFLSCFFIRLKKDKNKTAVFSQDLFDYTVKQIELNLREIGYGDVSVNKAMKKFVTTFYNVLLNVENFDLMKCNEKHIYILSLFSDKKTPNNIKIDDFIRYFTEFKTYAMNLSVNDIFDANINFNKD